MQTLSEILQDPNYINANEATKRAIFDRYSQQDTNYTSANEATQFAIRKRFGVFPEVAFATPKPVEAEKPGAFVSGFKSYLPQLQETFGGIKTLAGVAAERAIGEGNISKGLIESGRASMAEAQAAQQGLATAERGSFSDALAKGVGSVLTEWLPYQAGSGAANILEALAVTGAGALAGTAAAPGAGTAIGAGTGLVARELAKRGIKEAAEQVIKEQGEEAAKDFFAKEASKVAAEIGAKYAARGQAAALGTQAGFYGAGQTTSRAVEEAQTQGGTASDIELSRVLPAAAVSGVAEFISDKIGLGAFKGMDAPGKSLVMNIAKSIALAGTKEAPTEVIQAVAERYGAKLSLDDAAALKEYIDSAAAAYAMSVAPGAVGGARGTMQYRAEEAAKPKVETIPPAAPEAAAPEVVTIPPEPPEVPAITYSPDPLISFPDGTVARKGEYETYIASLPEEQQVEARAKMIGMGQEAVEIKPEMLISLGIRPRAPIVQRLAGLEINDPKVVEELTEFAKQPYASPQTRGNIFGFLATIKPKEVEEAPPAQIEQPTVVAPIVQEAPAIQPTVEAPQPPVSVAEDIEPAVTPTIEPAEIVSAAPVVEPAIQAPSIITAQVLTDLGVKPGAAIVKRLEGKPIDDPEVVTQLENYAKRYAPAEIKPAITNFVQTIAAPKAAPVAPPLPGKRVPQSDLTGPVVGGAPVEMPSTTEPAGVGPAITEQDEYEQAIVEANKAERRATRLSKSLWGRLRGQLPMQDVRDVSPDKKFRSLGNARRGTSLSTLVADGSVDDFLPPDMRHDSPNFDEYNSTEYIKDRLREGTYIDFDAQMATQQIASSVEQLEASIDALQQEKEVNDLIQDAIAEQARAASEAESIEPSREAADSGAVSAEQEVEAGLESYTAEEIKIRQAAAKAEEKRIAGKEKAAQQKAKVASEVSEFDLTGSDRPADANKDQGAMFSVQKEVEKGSADLFAYIKDFDSALNAINQYASNDAQKEIASAITKKINALKRLGFKFTLDVTKDGYRLNNGARGQSVITYAGIGESTLVEITLNHPSNGDQSGTGWKTVAHEIAHAATQAQIKYAPQGSAAEKLNNLFNDVVKYFNDRAKQNKLTEFEKKIYERQNNALAAPDELLAWGLTDEEMQRWLNSIKSKNGNFLSRLFDVVAKVLGIYQNDTALAELLSISENLLTEVSDAYIEAANKKGQSFGLQANKTGRPAWALSLAYGRPIVWSEKDAALIETKSIAGGKIYLLATPTGISRVGVDSYSGPMLSPNRLKEVQRKAKELENGIPTSGTQETLFSISGKATAKAQQLLQKQKVPTTGLDHIPEDLRAMTQPIFFPQNKTVLDRIDGMKDKFWQRVAQGVADQYRTIKEYSPVAYMQARISKSIDGALEGLMLHGHVFDDGGALNIKANTKGVLKALEPVGKELDSYLMWVALNRESQLPEAKRSKAPNMDKLVANRAQFAAGELNGKSRLAVYESVAREMNALNKSVLDIALKKGLINQEGYDKFSKDIYYIPFYRKMEGGDLEGAQTASGLTSQDFSKELKGGEAPFGDLMENVLRNWSHILSASMKNQAATTTLEAAMEQNAAVPNLKPGLEWKDGKVYSTESGKLVAEKKDENGNVLYKEGELRPDLTKNEAGMAKIVKDGQVMYFQVTDPLLMEAISSIGYLGPKSKFLDVARDFKNILQFGVTLSPTFKVNNLIRDSVAAMGVSELAKDPISNIRQGISLSDPESPTYISALAGGAIFNFGSAYEGDQAKMIKRLLDKGVSRNTILDSDNLISKGLRVTWDKYQEWGNKSEAANRLALYQQMRDKGMSHLEASFKARDLLDFSMQGSWPAFRMVTQVVPFMNARIQGLYKLGRDGIIPTYRVLYNTATGKELNEEEKDQQKKDKLKAQAFLTVTAAVGLASAVLYLAFKDDEDFKKRDQWDRDNFWWFKLPDMEVAYRVPKPFEIGAFGTLVERTLEQIFDSGAEGKQFTDSLSRTLWDTFAMNPTPQMIKPLLDIYANKDSFTGAPIESAGLERLSKQERKIDTTSPIAVALGGVSSLFPEKYQLSPVQMDYMIKGYLGWLGGTAAVTSTYAVAPFREGEYPDARWLDRLSLGLAKELPTAQSKYVTAFYDSNKEISQAFADMRHYAEAGDSEKVQRILEERGDKIALAKFYDKTAKSMASVRQQINIVTKDATMGGAEKKMEIDRLKQIISTLAQQAEEVRKSMKK